MKFTNENLSYDLLCEYISEMKREYPKIFFGVIGRSLLGRKIPVIKIGNGEKISVFVGTHHAMEHITANILLKFANDIIYGAEHRQTLFSKSLEYITKTRTIYIIPMLNPDGVELELFGANPKEALYERQLAMNGGDDFSHWQANARGVDLNHNYNAGFEKMKLLEAEMGIDSPRASRFGGAFPESEPEAFAMAEFLRKLYEKDLRCVVSLHTQGEEIYYGFEGLADEKTKNAARTAASLCGYKLGEVTGIASYGGLKDYVADKMHIPAFTFECGKGENPLPTSQWMSIYQKIAPALLYLATL